MANPTAFNREPCFWTSTVPGYNTADRQRTEMRDGKKVTIRFPQSGHAGDYENRTRAQGSSFLWMIDHHGFEAPIVFTCAAAHMNPHDAYGQHMQRKARHFGWFMPGQCPCALLTTGELSPNHIVDKSLLKATPCAPGTYDHKRRCPHSLSERAARAAQNKAIQDEREALMQSGESKGIEATKELTKQLVDVVASLPAQVSAAVNTRNRGGDKS